MKLGHSLAAVEYFKMLYGIDEREDDLARFLLETATSQIEGYTMRRLVFKRITQGFELTGDNAFQLLDYPVRSVWKVEADYSLPFDDTSLVLPEHYHLSPSTSDLENYPYFLHLHSSSLQYHIRKIVKVVYCAGYKVFDVPANLKKACLELAAWNYKQQKENSFDGSMPANVRELLEPYRRKVI
jgi:uncharacterized phiE125 gp8 family phage protein